MAGRRRGSEGDGFVFEEWDKGNAMSTPRRG